MKMHYTAALSLLAGVALGAAAIQSLHAQAKPPIYYVAEIDVTNADAYAKEYVPKAQALIKASGGRIVAASSKVSAMEGAAPKRVAVITWESMEKLQAWRNSAEFKDNRKTGDKYAKFRSYALEGMPQ